MVNWLVIGQFVAGMLTAAGRVLAWTTKLFYGKEFAQAKDEIIRAKGETNRLLGVN